jgi:hypothetical protein
MKGIYSDNEIAEARKIIIDNESYQSENINWVNLARNKIYAQKTSLFKIPKINIKGLEELIPDNWLTRTIKGMETMGSISSTIIGFFIICKLITTTIKCIINTSITKYIGNFAYRFLTACFTGMTHTAENQENLQHHKSNPKTPNVTRGNTYTIHTHI